MACMQTHCRFDSHFGSFNKQISLPGQTGSLGSVRCRANTQLRKPFRSRTDGSGKRVVWTNFQVNLKAGQKLHEEWRICSSAMVDVHQESVCVFGTFWPGFGRTPLSSGKERALCAAGTRNFFGRLAYMWRNSLAILFLSLSLSPENCPQCALHTHTTEIPINWLLFSIQQHRGSPEFLNGSEECVCVSNVRVPLRVIQVHAFDAAE